MAQQGDVVFQKGVDEDNQSDIWDDTALIKAYDDAVKMAKASLGVCSPSAVNQKTKGATEKPKKKNKRNRNKKEKKKHGPAPPPAALREWSIGEHCRCVYTEDGCIYEAVITEINGPMCNVRYLGYGNEEQQFLADLLLPVDAVSKEGSETADTESDIEWRERSQRSPSLSSSYTSSRGGGCSSRGTGRGRGASRSKFWDWPPPPPVPPYPGLGGMGPSPGFPMMPPPFPGMGSGFPGGWPSMPNSPPMVPQMPPPPPVDEDVITSDSEALYSMLISWYMSGYHTGYYQGLKQGKGSKSSDHHTCSSNHTRKRPDTRSSDR